MNTKTIANSIKSLDREGRQKLAQEIRTDANAWNGVNGLGDIQKDLPDGKLNGVVKDGVQLLPGVKVQASQGADIVKEVASNPDGTYSLELPAGTYDMKYALEGYYDTIENEKCVVCDTAITLNSEMTKL